MIVYLMWILSDPTPARWAEWIVPMMRQWERCLIEFHQRSCQTLEKVADSSPVLLIQKTIYNWSLCKDCGKWWSMHPMIVLWCQRKKKLFAQKARGQTEIYFGEYHTWFETWRQPASRPPRKSLAQRPGPQGCAGKAAVGRILKVKPIEDMKDIEQIFKQFCGGKCWWRTSLWRNGASVGTLSEDELIPPILINFIIESPLTNYPQLI